MIHLRTITYIRPRVRQVRRRSLLRRIWDRIATTLLTVLMMIIGAGIGYGILIALGGYGQ